MMNLPTNLFQYAIPSRCLVGVFVFVAVPLEYGGLRMSFASDCMQETPLLYGCQEYRQDYAHICCQVPQRYAENRGFLETVNFFQQLENSGASAGEMTFYDSKCGVPLYVAPRGRTYAEFKAESIKHGWPSFRSQEVVREHVRVSNHGGEVISWCNTHLGHDLPDASGERHCINLMCMAGVFVNNTGNSTAGGGSWTHLADHTQSSSSSKIAKSICLSSLLLLSHTLVV